MIVPPKPSVRLNDLLTGKIAWDDASPAIQSWAQLTIYKAAVQVCQAPTAKARSAMLAKIPATVRPQVEAKVQERLTRG